MPVTPDAVDAEILDAARRERRVVITADLDYPRLLALEGAEGPGVILLRGGSYSDREMLELLDRVMTTVPETDIECSIIVVDRRQIRRRRLPIL
jgi:predicted nuclease of predicted toxin-antitoxin system